MNSFTKKEILEEKANALTHAAGVLFGFISIPFLIWHSLQHSDETVVAATGVYGASFLAVFLCSSIFHYLPPGRLREKLKIADHISIYFMIAGTYTPFILIFVNNSFGLTLLAVLWTLTIFGTIFKIYYTGRYEWLSIIIYIAMGWMLFAGGSAFFENMPSTVVTLIVTGGVIYTLGVLFYAFPLFPFHHTVWHLFSLAGALCHFSAVAMSVS